MSRERHAFTLAELLAALFVLGVLLVASLPALVRMREDAGRRAAARALHAAAQYSRSLAVTRQTEVRLVLDSARSTFRIETRRPEGALEGEWTPERTALGQERALPGGIVMQAEASGRGEAQAIPFYPNGGSGTAVITLTDRSQRRLYVLIRGGTGTARITSDEEQARRFTERGL